MGGVRDKKVQPKETRPQMKLEGTDGNIFAILGEAARLLREDGQPDQAAEMTRRVFQSHSYESALSIISEYVETEPSPHISKKDRGEER